MITLISQRQIWITSSCIYIISLWWVLSFIQLPVPLFGHLLKTKQICTIFKKILKRSNTQKNICGTILPGGGKRWAMVGYVTSFVNTNVSWPSTAEIYYSNFSEFKLWCRSCEHDTVAIVAAVLLCCFYAVIRLSENSVSWRLEEVGKKAVSF